MSTRRIRLLVGVAGPDHKWRKGQIVELDEHEAAKWADGHRAVYAEPGEVEATDLATALEQLDQARAELAARVAELEALRAELATLRGDQGDDAEDPAEAPPAKTANPRKAAKAARRK